MDKTLLVNYLKFLEESADTLLRKDLVDGYDVAALQREIANFKADFKPGALGGTAVEDSILALELTAREADFGGGTAGVFRLLLNVLFRRWVVDEVERQKQAEVKRKIEDFRNEISHILFAFSI